MNAEITTSSQILETLESVFQEQQLVAAQAGAWTSGQRHKHTGIILAWFCATLHYSRQGVMISQLIKERPGQLKYLGKHNSTLTNRSHLSNSTANTLCQSIQSNLDTIFQKYCSLDTPPCCCTTWSDHLGSVARSGGGHSQPERSSGPAHRLLRNA